MLGLEPQQNFGGTFSFKLQDLITDQFFVGLALIQLLA
jgi:hypothetical protein